MALTFTFDGESSATHNITIERVLHDVLPPTRDRDIIIPGKRGRYPLDTDLDQHTMTFVCRIVETTYDGVYTRAENIAAWLNPEKGVKELTFSARTGRTFKAKISGITPVDQMLIRGRFNVAFIIPDGVAYGTEATWNTGEPTIDNAGTTKSPAIITATIATATPYFEIDIAGVTLRLDMGLAITDVIIIDTEHRTVTVNTIDSRSKLTTYAWPEINPSTDNVVTVDPIDTVLEIKYRPRWL